MQAIVTDLGYTKIQYALANSETVDVSYFKIGSTIITLDPSMTSVTDLVYTGTSSELRISKVSTDSVRFRVQLFDTVGPFNVGNIGIYTTDDTLVAIATLAELAEKTVSSGSSSGNVLIYDIIIICSGVGSTINLTITYPTGIQSVGLDNVDGNITVAGSPLTSDGSLTVNLSEDISVADTISEGGYRVAPTGTIIMWPLSTPPGGHLECDGAAVSRSTYSKLWAVLGTTYGSGNGTTTFNLPDYRSVFLRGWDHGKGVDASRSLGSYQSDQNLAHTHSTTVNDPGHSHTIPVGADGIDGGSGCDASMYNSPRGPTGTSTTGITVSVESSGGGTEVRVKNISVMFCIKYT